MIGDHSFFCDRGCSCDRTVIVTMFNVIEWRDRGRDRRSRDRGDRGVRDRGASRLFGGRIILCVA